MAKLWTSARAATVTALVPAAGVRLADEARGGRQKTRPERTREPDRLERRSPAPTFTVDAPALRVAAGKIAGTAFDLGDVHFDVADLPRGDASIALVALDGLPLSLSKEMLLVAVARVENTAMKWNAERTGLTSWGHGPAVAEYVPLRVSLPGPQLRAERLDPAGGIAAELAVTAEAGGGAGGRSILHLDREPSLWFLLRR